MNPPIAILNTSILTAEGTFSLQKISLSEAKILASGEIISAIGHESTAQIITKLLGVDIPMNRINFEQKVGQKALVFKLKGRAPEGVILTEEQIEEIGYDFFILTRNF